MLTSQPSCEVPDPIQYPLTEGTEEVFRLVFEAAPNGIVVTNPAGKIVLVNRQAERMFGYDRNEFIGLSVDALVPPHLQDQHQALRQSFAAHPTARAMGAGRDLYARRKDGTEFPVEVGLTPLETQETSLVVSSVLDITERKQAEQTLKRYAEGLEHSNTELKNFAYVASHDLQEPLRKITAFGERLEKDYASALDARGSDYLQRMVDATTRMQVLISDLLSFSRVSRSDHRFVPVDLNAILQGVLRDLEVAITESGATVQVPVLPGIDADESQMRQLLQNLISNALKFHHPGEPPQVEILAEKTEDDRLRLLVQDEGIGFDPAYQERIFGVFRRLHGRDQYAGTGIGLAICRKIAALHNGTITARSDHGAGATFVVDLPLHQAHHGEGFDA